MHRYDCLRLGCFGFLTAWLCACLTIWLSEFGTVWRLTGWVWTCMAVWSDCLGLYYDWLAEFGPVWLSDLIIDSASLVSFMYQNIGICVFCLTSQGLCARHLGLIRSNSVNPIGCSDRGEERGRVSAPCRLFRWVLFYLFENYWSLLLLYLGY